MQHQKGYNVAGSGRPLTANTDRLDITESWRAYKSLGLKGREREHSFRLLKKKTKLSVVLAGLAGSYSQFPVPNFCTLSLSLAKQTRDFEWDRGELDKCRGSVTVKESFRYICSDLQVGLRLLEIYREKIHCERFKPSQREFWITS
ncbi:hypothetical protein IMY05_006G0193800 [Salix suchowensis]|nr:hypothetical protein IMY05_006G0193800 [Salix suchowensis]